MLNSLYLAVIVAPLFAPAPSEPSIQYAPGYPFAIPGTGIAVIKGVARADKDHRFVHAQATYFINGGVATTKSLPISDRGVLGPIVIWGLRRDTEYQIMIEITQVRDDDRDTFINNSSVFTR